MGQESWAEPTPLLVPEGELESHTSLVLFGGTHGTATALWLRIDQAGNQSVWASRLE